jgi:DNA-binding CsgD family transcriptional regulator
LRARLNAGVGFAALGYDADALALLEPLLADLTERRLAALAATATMLIAQMHLRAGRFAAARAAVERALADPEPNTIVQLGIGAAALGVGVALCDEELIAAAVPASMPAFALRCGVATALGRFAGPYARWRAQAGERDAARDYLGRALDLGLSPAVAPDLALAAFELGDRPLRERATAFAAPLAESEAPLLRAHLAALALMHAHDPGAVEAARAAEASWTAGGWLPAAARCAELAGERERAFAVYRDLGALAEVRRLGLAARSDAAQAGDRGGLSPREWEIAALVAAGTSNKELADRLAVSPKTIEKHLTAIYDKLGFRRRSELAAFVARRG